MMIPPGCFNPARFRPGGRLRLFFIAALVCMAAGLSVFRPQVARPAEGPPVPQQIVRVAVSIHPVALLVAEVGGERVAVSTLLPPGASPHGFEPSPRQVRDLAGADLVITVGGGLDPWAEQAVRALAHDRPRLVLARSAGIPDAGGHGHHHPAGDEGMAGEASENPDAGDPHVWLDPILVRDVLVPDIVAALARQRPDLAGEFSARGAAFRERLTGLDSELSALLRPVSGQAFVAFHGSWGRFSRHYGLHPVGVVMPFPGREPSARQMAGVIEAARAEHAAAVLVEPQFSPRIARLLAGQFGGRLVEVDPMGGPDKPYGGDYIRLMRFNGQAFAEGLKP